MTPCMYLIWTVTDMADLIMGGDVGLFSASIALGL